MAGFATRLALNEGGYFNTENRASLVNRVRALVEAGELPQSVLHAIDAPAAGGVPTEIRRRPDFEQAFHHVHNKWKPGAALSCLCNMDTRRQQRAPYSVILTMFPCVRSANAVSDRAVQAGHASQFRPSQVRGATHCDVLE